MESKRVLHYRRRRQCDNGWGVFRRDSMSDWARRKFDDHGLTGDVVRLEGIGDEGQSLWRMVAWV